MKSFKLIVVILASLMVLLAIAMFVLHRIDTLSFILWGGSQAGTIALYFLDRNRQLHNKYEECENRIWMMHATTYPVFTCSFILNRSRLLSGAHELHIPIDRCAIWRLADPITIGFKMHEYK